MSLASKVFWSLSAVLVVAVMALISWESRRNQFEIQQETEELTKDIASTFNLLAESSGNTLTQTTAYISKDPHINQLLAEAHERFIPGQSDARLDELRHELYEMMLPAWDELHTRQGIRHMHFHLYHGGQVYSFLRLHKPDRYGDELDTFRFMLDEVEKTHKPVCGIELGYSQLSMRGIHPISVSVADGERFVGSVEVGIDPELLLAVVNRVHGVETGIVLNREYFDELQPLLQESQTSQSNDAWVLESGSLSHWDQLSKRLSTMLSGVDIRSRVEMFAGRQMHVTVSPIREHAGLASESRPFAYLVAFHDCDHILNAMKSELAHFKATAILALILLEAFLFLGLWVVQRKLNRIIASKQASLQEANRQLHREVQQRSDAEQAVLEREACLRGVIDGSNAGIVVLDHEGNILDVNVTYRRNLSLSAKQIIGANLFTLLPEDIARQRRHECMQVLRTGMPFRHEEYYKNAWSDYVIYPIKTKTGEADRVVIQVRDVTARKNAESALRDSEGWFRSVFNGSKDAVFILDDQGRIADVNHSGRFLSGYHGEVLAGMFFSKLVEGFDLEASKSGDSATHTQLSRQLVRYDRSRIDVELNSQRIIIGEKVYFHVAVRDISERLRAAERLQESEERFRLLAENAPGIIYLCANDETWSMHFLNDVVEELTGYSKELFLNHQISFADLYHPDDKDEVYEKVERAIEAHVPYHLKYRLRHRDGHYCWVEEIGDAIRRGGQIIFLEGFLRDISDVILAEQEREKLEEQLRQAQKMEAVGQLAGGVAHDFNNILQVINGYVDLLSDTLDKSSPDYECLGEIKQAGDRAATLVRQLLTFSRRQALNPEFLNLNQVVERLMKMVGRLIGEHITIHYRLAPDVGSIYADPGQVEQIIVNLCVNARDAMSDGGTLTIETFDQVIDDDPDPNKCGNWVGLAVTDSGPGIEPEVRDRIFEPFFTTKNVGEGTGLGLATVYAVVQRHHGILELQSEPGSGAKFRILLPAVEYEQNDEKTQAKNSKNHMGGHETVLMVEDDEMVRNLAEKVLTRAGYRVITAEEGGEGILLFEKHQDDISLAILDVIMPNKNGAEVWQTIRTVDEALPIIFCSGYSENYLPENVRDDTRVSMLTKPHGSRQLLSKVREMLDMGADVSKKQAPSGDGARS